MAILDIYMPFGRHKGYQLTGHSRDLTVRPELVEGSFMVRQALKKQLFCT